MILCCSDGPTHLAHSETRDPGAPPESAFSPFESQAHLDAYIKIMNDWAAMANKPGLIGPEDLVRLPQFKVANNRTSLAVAMQSLSLVRTTADLSHPCVRCDLDMELFVLSGTSTGAYMRIVAQRRADYSREFIDRASAILRALTLLECLAAIAVIATLMMMLRRRRPSPIDVPASQHPQAEATMTPPTRKSKR